MDKTEQEEEREAIQEELGLPEDELIAAESESARDAMAGVSYAKELSRLNRIRGQIAGVRKMIDQGRGGMEVLIQLKAARAAIKSVEARILRRHMRDCIDVAFRGPREEAEKRMEELKKYFDSDMS